MASDRKTRRFSHTLYRHVGVRAQNEPTQNLVLCNAGFSTGLKEKDLALTFQNFGTIEKILLIPEKSFCIVAFNEISSAIKAYDNLNVPSLESGENNVAPNGLHLIENFITHEEEKILLSTINSNSSYSSNLKNRKVKHYGYEFLYGSNNIDVNNPLNETIPSQCDFLWERLKTVHNISIPGPPNQLTVNQYEPGQGIPSHIDTHSAFHSPLISLSLESSLIMEFKKPTSKTAFEYYKVPLPPRSILLLNGSSRYEWSHGIASRTYDIIDGKVQERNRRTSFTFRWIRFDGKCDCKFNLYCDTFINNQKNQMDLKNLAPLIEKHHVHQVYEKIASHFDNTRNKIWPCVNKFVNNLPMGSILIDVGCGNGKNLHIRHDIMQIGIEYSEALANIAAWKSMCENEARNETKSLVQIIQGNCLNIPLNSNFADAVISIAVFHHLVTEERRRTAIFETVRILKSGGIALITVWARDQHKGDVKTSYLKQDRKNRKSTTTSDLQPSCSTFETLCDENGQSLNVSLPIHQNRNDFLHQDLLVPWKLKHESCDKDNSENSDYMRFYHVFEEDELKSLCESVEGVIIENIFYEQGNWCIILKKI